MGQVTLFNVEDGKDEERTGGVGGRWQNGKEGVVEGGLIFM